MRRTPAVPFLLLTLTAVPLLAQANEHRLVPAGPELEEAWSSVSGLRALADGRLVVSDAIEESLQLVDPRSGAIRALGRKGAGPGEFGQPDLLLPLPDDATLLVDLGNARLTRVAPDGSMGPSHSLVLDTGEGFRILLPAAADARGNLYAQPNSREPRDSGDVIRFRAGERGETPVARVGLPAVARSSSGPANDRREIGMPQPYSARDAWAVAPDGRIAVARTSPYRLDWIGADGRVAARGPAVDWTPARIGAADREAWMARMGSGILVQETNQNGRQSLTLRRGSPGGRPLIPVDQLEWPETMPAFPPAAVRVAPDGTAWVERYGPSDAPPRHDLFDARGQRVRQVVLPSGTRLAGFGPGVVWLVRTDDDGLQWLRPYRMPG